MVEWLLSFLRFSALREAGAVERLDFGRPILDRLLLQGE